MTFPIDDEFDPASSIPFSTDTHRRRTVVLILDVSWSMLERLPDGRPAIEALNAHLRQWLPQLRAEGRGALRDTDFAVISLGKGGVQVISGDGDSGNVEDGGAFVPAASLELSDLSAAGASPLVEAITMGLQLAEGRRRYLQEVRSLQAGTPRILVVSDGKPTDEEGNSTNSWTGLATRLAAMRAARRVRVYAFGVPSCDERVMRALAGADGFFALARLDIKQLLDLVLTATLAGEENPFQAVVDSLDGDHS